jgi:methyl-accepting chemotaxis protein
MDLVTQKNAAMVEEMTAAAHRLAGETEELGQLVARCQIRGTATKEDPRRAELKKAAPHVFRASPKTAAPAAPAQARAKPIRRPAIKAVVNRPVAHNAASGGASDDWQEF